MQKNPVSWFEIYVQDMTRARAFYETVLGVKLQKLGSPELDMWGFPMLPDGSGASGALCKLEGCVPAKGGTVVYFDCDNCAIEGARVKEAGGGITRPKFSIGNYGYVVLAIDTEGNMFGLHSMK